MNARALVILREIEMELIAEQVDRVRKKKESRWTSALAGRREKNVAMQSRGHTSVSQWSVLACLLEEVNANDTKSNPINHTTLKVARTDPVPKSHSHLGASLNI